MEKSLMTNAVQVYSSTSTGSTYSTPLVMDILPCGAYITYLASKSQQNIVFRIKQDGKQIFPVRSNHGYQYFLSIGGNAPNELYGLWIPIKPNLVLSVEYSDTGTAGFFSLNLVMASEDERSVLYEMLDKTLKFRQVKP